MKKICFVTTKAGTIESFLVGLSQYMVTNDDFDVTFIADECDRLQPYLNDKIHCIPVKMKRGIAFDGIGVICKLYHIFKEENFDAVQYSTKNASVYASIAAFLAKVPTRIYCQWGMMFVALTGIKRVLMKWIELLISGLATDIEVESFSMYEKAIEEHIYKPEKAKVIWNGSACGVALEKYDLSRKQQWRDEVRAKYGISGEAIVFGYCGRITKDKGLNELFNAFRALIKETDRDAYLMIIGAYDHAETIDQELFNWALNNERVVFTGYTREVPKFYSALDVFCSLSYREGFGLVVIEAAAMEVPSIVSDALGQRDTTIDKQTGLITRTHNMDDVIEAMRFYVSDSSAAPSMGKNARKMVEEKYEQNELFKLLSANKSSLIVKNSL